MRLTIDYSKIKKRNLVLINNDTYQRETLSERPIRQPLRSWEPGAIVLQKVLLLHRIVPELGAILKGPKAIIFSYKEKILLSLKNIETLL